MCVKILENANKINTDEYSFFLRGGVVSLYTWEYVIFSNFLYVHKVYTVKPLHVVTSIKQSPVLKGHLYLVLS